MRAIVLGLAVLILTAMTDGPRDWPDTDFSKHAVPFAEIEPGGPPKDAIRAIDRPRFTSLVAGEAFGWAAGLADREPVISLEIDGDARAYPLGIMIRHEIVNDRVAGQPVAITYCPLCNAALTFSREVDDQILQFGVSGLLRNADLIMFDRQSESWWQQFSGEAIVGARSGQRLKLLPSRLESFGRFRARFPEGRVLIPEDPERRDYFSNPYRGYDLPGGFSRFYDGPLPSGIEPMARVVALVDPESGKAEAWSLTLLRLEGEILVGDLRLSWIAGQSTALGAERIAEGRDVGNVVVERRTAEGWQDLPYHLVFAFAFHAFEPDATIHGLEAWSFGGDEDR
ncbi:MAG: DUF3179 domain-containing protein [Rhodospirillales bacterium]